MVAKRGKKPTKKLKTLSTKSMSAKKAGGVRGGSFTIKQTAAGHEKWIELSPNFTKIYDKD
jgi:hypothetical protein